MEIITKKNVSTLLEKEIAWIEAVIDTALTLYFRNECPYKSVYELTPPILSKDDEGYAGIVKKYALEFEDRVMLIMALLPHLRPQSLDVFLIRNTSLDCEFSEFGGLHREKMKGFAPTLETVCFILGGGDHLETRLRFMKLLHAESALFKAGILISEHHPVSLSDKLEISNAYLGLITTGERYHPRYSSGFPAKRIETALEWDDLVLESHIKEELLEVKEWLVHEELILKTWSLEKNLKPGYKVLFYGPPGTGKTMAATLIGKSVDLPVYRIDLSMTVSKYIGETEKNLSRLFDEAATKGWILFFDEADALFGKRTQTNSSNDRYANQEVAYLLQRIEDYEGLVILATNLQSNIDEAFSRRFQNSIGFPKPKYKERLILWQKLVADHFEIQEGSSVLDRIAQEYELSGGEIVNILRYCAIKAAGNGHKKITAETLMEGIKREYSKLNKTIH